MGFLTTTLAFVVVLGIIIFVHEFGHLITAKAFGMRVFVFSFGFGKRLLGFKWGETDCRVSAIPLGGYVKLEGEPGDHLSEDTAALGDGKDFLSRPRWQRFLVYLAGPAMNALLTITVLSGFYMVGFAVEGSRYDRPIVGAVEAGSPAEKAGLVPGDEIVSIDGKPLPSWEEAQYHIILRPETSLALRVRRGGEEREVAVRSEATAAEKIGSIGVSPPRPRGPGPARPARRGRGPAHRRRDPLDRRQAAALLRRDPADRGRLGRAGDDVPRLAGGAGVRPRDHPEGLRGGAEDRHRAEDRPQEVRPGGRGRRVVALDVGDDPADLRRGRPARHRADLAEDDDGPARHRAGLGGRRPRGAGSLLFLVAVISLQVGILNLFPLAPLDGGHLAILAVEGVARRDLSPTVKGWIMNAGAAVIFLLIGVVLYSDISKMAFVQRLFQ